MESLSISHYHITKSYPRMLAARCLRLLKPSIKLAGLRGSILSADQFVYISSDCYEIRPKLQKTVDYIYLFTYCKESYNILQCNVPSL